MLTATILAWAAYVAACDLRRRHIPNFLSLGAVAVAIGILLVQGASASGGSAVSAVLAAGIAIALTLPAYIGHALGAGDVKLAVAMGLLSDAATFGVGFIVGAVFAGVWAAAWLVVRRTSFLAPRLCSSGRVRDEETPAASRRPVPFGAALCAGFAASLLMRGMLQGI